MRFSDILGLAVFLSSATGMPTRPVLCGDDYCTCLTGPEALGPGFGTPEECIAYAKENNYDDWLRKREIPLPIRRDSDVDFFCNNDPDFLGYDTLDDCIACAEDNDDCPDNVDWPEKRGNPSPIRRDSSPSSFNDDFDVLSEREDSQGPCTGKLDLCITIIVPNNVEKSFSVRFDEDTALGVSIDSSSHVGVNLDLVDPAYDLTRCFFSGTNYPVLDTATQPPQLPEKISERPAVHLAHDNDPSVYNIGPPQNLLQVHCPSPASS